jgi:hypothetical protein
MNIDDGIGRGFSAKVNKENRLGVESVSLAAQAVRSREYGEAFQVEGTITITTSDTPVLWIRNDSQDKLLVVTYLRVMSIGAAASNVDGYFTIKLGSTYTSGGGAVTPVNLNRNSGRISPTVAYDGSSSLTLSGGSQIDKNWEANSMQAYNKEGSIVLGNNDAISVWHKGSTVAGSAYARISYYFIDKTDNV